MKNPTLDRYTFNQNSSLPAIEYADYAHGYNPECYITDTGIKYTNVGKLSKVNCTGTISTNNTEPTLLSRAWRNLVGLYRESSGATRCVDGRCEEDVGIIPIQNLWRFPIELIDLKHNIEAEQELGPQVPGGVPGATITLRLSRKEPPDNITFTQDFNNIYQVFIDNDLDPGAHTDDQEHTRDQVGCGAIDGVVQILEALANEELRERHLELVKMIIGTVERETGVEFNQKIYDEIINNAKATKVNKQSIDEKKNAISKLKNGIKGTVKTLKGKHKEIFILINCIKDTTLDSKQFSIANYGLQAFNYDFWRSLEIADILDESSEKLYDFDKQRFIMARVMYAVATFMALTDGSLEVILRTESDESEPNLATVTDIGAAATKYIFNEDNTLRRAS